MKIKICSIFAPVIAKVAQLVEHNLAKVRVAGSSPVFRSSFLRKGCSDGGMVDTKDLKSFGYCSCAGSSPAPSTFKDANHWLINRLAFFCFSDLHNICTTQI